MTTAANKTIDSPSVLTLQALATGAQVASAAIDVTNKFAVRLTLFVGRTVATALTNQGLTFLIQYAMSSDPFVPWRTHRQLATGPLVAASAAATLSSSGSYNLAAGSYGKTNALVLTGNAPKVWLPQDVLYIRNSTVANGEWYHAVSSGTGSTAVTITSDILNNQQGSGLWDGNYIANPLIDVTTMRFLRVVAVNNGGVTLDVAAFCSSWDSVG
jgi:hypothetical protein